MGDTHPVSITFLEGLFLSDSLSMYMQGPSDAPVGQASSYPDLILKIGSAVLETDQTGSSVTVHLTLPELWIIREVAKSSVVVGSERVGLNLLLKVYKAMGVLTAGPDMESIVSALGEVVDDEPGKGEYAAKLGQLRDDNDLAAGGVS